MKSEMNLSKQACGVFQIISDPYQNPIPPNTYFKIKNFICDKECYNINSIHDETQNIVSSNAFYYLQETQVYISSHS